MGKRFAMLISVAAAGVMALGAETQRRSNRLIARQHVVYRRS